MWQSMNRRVRQSIFVIGLVTSGVAIVATLKLLKPMDEPSYNNKPLSAWLDDRITRPDGTAVLSDESVFAVQQIGHQAIPELLQWLQYSDPPGFRQLRFGANIPVPLNDVWRTRAMYGFRALGDAAAPAIPDLVKLALYEQDEPVRLAAINTLTNHHPEALRLLSASLRSTDPAARLQAADVFGYIRPAAAIPLLTAALSDSDAGVRAKAARALRFYVSPLVPDVTLDALNAMSSDSDMTVRVAAQSAIDSQTAYRQSGMFSSKP